MAKNLQLTMNACQKNRGLYRVVIINSTLVYPDNVLIQRQDHKTDNPRHVNLERNYGPY